MISIFALLLSGCCLESVKGLIPGMGQNCTTQVQLQKVCTNQTTKEPYVEQGNCVMTPVEVKDCKNETVAMKIADPSLTGRTNVAWDYCLATASVVVTNPNPYPVDMTMGFVINIDGNVTRMSDTKTVPALNIESLSVKFQAPGWDCSSSKNRPSVDLDYALPQKEACTSSYVDRNVCENVTKYTEKQAEVCQDEPTEVKVC